MGHEMESKIVAFPESSYHIELLQENCPEVDLYLIKCGVALSAESLPDGADYVFFEADKFSWNFVESIRLNARLYKSLSNLISGLNVGKLIIFGDAKPFHKYIIDLCISRGICVELWEDGLGYYIGTGHKFKFFLKGLIKVLGGAYPKSFFSEQYRRKEIVTRDRFVQKNLSYPAREPVYEGVLDRIAFIGQPLVSDGYLSAEKYVSVVESIHDQTGILVDYLPHPRERELSFDESKVHVVSGVGTESYLRSVKYLHYTTAFSTALINLSGDNRSFCPGLFGLKRVERELMKYPELGVGIVRDFSKVSFVLDR